jgi:hypothetical protein
MDPPLLILGGARRTMTISSNAGRLASSKTFGKHLPIGSTQDVVGESESQRVNNEMRKNAMLGMLLVNLMLLMSPVLAFLTSILPTFRTRG